MDNMRWFHPGVPENRNGLPKSQEEGPTCLNAPELPKYIPEMSEKATSSYGMRYEKKQYLGIICKIQKKETKTIHSSLLQNTTNKQTIEVATLTLLLKLYIAVVPHAGLEKNDKGRRQRA